MTRTPPVEEGFGLAELMVVLLIIGVLSALVVPAGLARLQRQRLNAVALGLAGWLEEVRRSSLRGTGCQVEISTGASLGGAAVVAQIDGQATPGCPSREPFRLPQAVGADRFTVAFTPMPATFRFTPLGTRWLDSGRDPNADMVITIAGNGYSVGMARCLQLNGLLGTLELGTVQGGSCAVDRL